MNDTKKLFFTISSERLYRHLLQFSRRHRRRCEYPLHPIWVQYHAALSEDLFQRKIINFIIRQNPIVLDTSARDEIKANLSNDFRSTESRKT
jgi:hypothetical protein